MIRALVFDFDGVLVESTQIKTEAFRDLFADYPEHQEEIVALHASEPGRSRYWKFARIYADILQLPLDEATSQSLGRRFSELVEQRVIACPWVAGAREFLEAGCQGRDAFIASGTPEAELRRILEARGAAGRFRGIYGSPAGKAEILARILDETGYLPSEVIMIGDARADLEGARLAGTFFLGRQVPGEPVPFEAARLACDLTELPEWLACFDRAVPVSVVVCTYNGRSRGYLETALHTIESQTVFPEEVLVVDDGSDDGTGDWVRSRFPRMRVLEQANGGLAAARNRGIRATTCPLLCFLDDDDAWRPDKLACQVHYLNHDRGQEIGVLFSALRLIDGAGRPVGFRRAVRPRWGWPEVLLGNQATGPSAAMLRRPVLTQVGDFRAGLRGAEDYDYWIRASQHGTLACQDQPLTDYRVHSAQMSTHYTWMTEKALELVVEYSRALPTGAAELAVAYNAYGTFWMGLLTARWQAVRLAWRHMTSGRWFPMVFLVRLLGMLLRVRPELQRSFRVRELDWVLGSMKVSEE